LPSPGKRDDARISETALDRIARCRAAFLKLIDSDPAPVIYGVTTAMGELASTRLAKEERDRHARIKAFAAATSFGDPFPDRVVRGIVLARLANFLEGDAATTPRITLAVADMLDGRPMPIVPSSGQGGTGEILALYPLFRGAHDALRSRVKERDR
jgi:histidine ammonia-lyase